MITFETITEDTIKLALDIVNSNSFYNRLENGNPLRSLSEVYDEFLNPDTDSYFIKIENKYVGIIDYLNNNPKDNYPWIGLLMIHGNDHSLRYGRKAFHSFEKILKQQKVSKVRIGVLETNSHALHFWKSLNFIAYGTSVWRGHTIVCLEKQIN